MPLGILVSSRLTALPKHSKWSRPNNNFPLTFDSDTCLPHNFFDFCENNFCVDCKDGYAAKCQWGCIDCLRRGGLVDLFQSEQNEKDGNLCAHCFLSEDDMDGVKLFTCVDCGTVKYCSKACQKAHIHEHRDDCLAHEKKDETA